jgi:adenosine deaminase
MFETSLTNEYYTLAGQGFSWRELWALNRATLDGSFLTEGERKGAIETVGGL